MRVLHLYAGNLYGGIEKLLITLAAERHQCPTMEPQFALCFEGRLSKELREAGASLDMMPAVRLSRPWTVWSARRAMSRFLNQQAKFDAVVTHSSWPHAVFAKTAREHGLPLFFWAHDAYLQLVSHDRMAQRTPPDRVIANSEFTLGTLPALFPSVPAQVLHYPIGAPPAMDRAAVRAEVRAAMGVAPETTVLFMAARMEPWKGHGHLLDALGHLAKTTGWVAWLGGGPQRPHEEEMFKQLQQKADALGLSEKVRFIGQRSDVPRLLCAADIHCQPNSGPEPFGIVFIEALQAGLPVVTTRLGAAPEIVDETCGRLAPPGDVAGLADILRDLINDPSARARLSAGGPARAEYLCGVAGQLEKLQRLLAGS